MGLRWGELMFWTARRSIDFVTMPNPASASFTGGSKSSLQPCPQTNRT
jgi:hypothetical protein